MIGSVANLQTLADAGALSTIFKPVIAASIETALGGSVSAGSAGAVASGLMTGAGLPMREVKRLLMLNGAETWGSENDLRNRLEMYVQQGGQNAGAQWNVDAKAWAHQLPVVVDPNPVNAKTSGFSVPAVPAGFSGAQWAPLVAGREAPKAVAKPAAAAPAPPPAAPAPAPAPPPPAAVAEAPAAAAPPADPNKSTFTVTLKTPDGDMAFECPPDMYMLDQTEELDNADDYADLPYACRAGSCSACAGKIISGTVDVSGCSFLDDKQKADGFILTCTAKPTSDCVIQTHVEDDLY